MIGTASAVLATLGLLLMGAAPTEFMLCFHQDGKVEVEHYQELCCKSACETSCPEEPPPACPDDQCHDVPLTNALQAVQGAPSVVPVVAPTLDVSSIEPPSPTPTFTLLASEPLSRDLDSPGSPALDLLRTVILRH
jgi:hypothetical protein